MLMRETIGEVLRRHRVEQDRTLRDVSSLAAVSLGYLSEIERGKKEPSSELLAAICDALDVPIFRVLREVSDELAAASSDAAVPAQVPAEGVVALAEARCAATGPVCLAA